MDELRAGAAAEVAPQLIIHLHQLPTSASAQEDKVSIAIALQQHLQQHSSSYIWHTGHPPIITTPFPSELTLTLTTPISAPDTDEWYALHLIITFFASTQHQQYAIQAFDSDGDFLLIQGADELPDWIDPSNALNRVWILPSSSSSPIEKGSYNLASLHLIGPDLAALPSEHSSTPTSLSVQDALQIIANEATKTPSEQTSGVSPALQSAAFEPMLDFISHGEAATFSNIHKTLAYLPNKRIASLLQREPQLCAQAIGALEGLSTDQLDRRVISRMERFGPLLSSPSSGATPSSSSSIVLAPVPLTKALYALSLHLVLFPPKPHFSHEWRESVARYRASQQDEETEEEDRARGGGDDGPKIMEIDEEAEQREREGRERKEREIVEGRWRDIGAKLICGLELLYARGRSRARKVVRPVEGIRREMDGQGVSSAQLEEFRKSSPRYPTFIKSLTSYGYFTSASTTHQPQPLLQGSREWYELEQSALERLMILEKQQQGKDKGKGKDTQDGFEDDGFSVRYRLENVPGLIDAYASPVSSGQGESSSSSSKAQTKEEQTHAEAILVDPHSSTLKDLLVLESSTDWLTELSQGRHEGDDDGGEEDGDGDEEEDGALERLQKLMQGTTDFLEEGEGDYRGAVFGDEGEDVEMSDDDDDDEDEDDLMDDDDLDDDDEEATARREARAEQSARRKAQSKFRTMDPLERARRMAELVSAVGDGEWGSKAKAATSTVEGVAQGEEVMQRAREEVRKLRALQQQEEDGGGSEDNMMVVEGNGSEEKKEEEARKRRVDLASALDAIPRYGHGNPSQSSSSAIALQNDQGGLNDGHRRKLVQEQVRADAKLLRREKHDGVSEDEGEGEEGEEGEEEDQEERKERLRRLRLHELPVAGALDEDEEGPSSSSNAKKVKFAADKNEGDDDDDDEGGEEGGGSSSFPDGPGIGPKGQQGEGPQEDEMSNFLDFTRKELGIDDALWDRIQADRRRDGRFLPATNAGGQKKAEELAATKKKKKEEKSGSKVADGKAVRFDGFARGFLNKKPAPASASASAKMRSSTRSDASVPVGAPSASAPVKAEPRKKTSLWTAVDSDDDDAEGDESEAPQGSGKGKGKASVAGVNNDDDDDDDGFYTLMDQMDAELAKAKANKVNGNGKGKGKVPKSASRTDRAPATEQMDLDDDEDDFDEELDAQDAELLQKLLSAQGGGGLGIGGGGGALGPDMLANFLESFKAQGSGPGPVSNLAGRLGVGRLPRDEDDK
ncbi:hypothetical protein CF327_g2564 [Tilletia walkeri]|nr:hypothetical protein CF327_g2564 [Tilletia walkeri]